MMLTPLRKQSMLAQLEHRIILALEKASFFLIFRDKVQFPIQAKGHRVTLCNRTENTDNS